MTPALLEPATTDAALRDQAAVIWHELDEELALERPEQALAAERKQRVRHRQKLFEDLRTAILLLARSPAWRTHDLALELLLVLEDLRAEIELDPDGADPKWRQRAALMRMRVVVQAMIRQLDHLAIDDPPFAAKLVAETLAEIEPGEVARLLGASVKSVENWRSGRVEQIKRNPNRIALVGQLVYELRGTMTPRGILLWFDAPREQLRGRTPRELIDDDVAAAADRLLPLARGGRGQLDV